MTTMGKLVLFLADGTTLDIPFDKARLSVGRRNSNDVCLPYPPVSGEHTIFVIVPTGVVVEDLGSTNGTLVNGKRVSRYFLHDRDKIEIGRQKLVYLKDVNDTVVPAAAKPEVVVRAKAGTETVGTEPPPALPMIEMPVGRPSRPAAQSMPEPSGPAMPALPQVGLLALGITGAEAAAGVFGPGAANGLAPSSAPAPELAAPPAPPAPVVSGPHRRVTSGPNAGRVLMLSGDEMLVGRVGRGVAAVRRDGDGFVLAHVEGDVPAQVNGVPASAAGLPLAAGDVIGVAGARIEFSVLPAPMAA